MNYCTNCGAKLQKEANFCNECGQKIDDIKAVIVEKISNKCPNCEGVLEEEAKFCTNCGFDLAIQGESLGKDESKTVEETVEPIRKQVTKETFTDVESAEEIVVDQRVRNIDCPNCGSILSEGSGFCSNCGFDISEHHSKEKTKAIIALDDGSNKKDIKSRLKVPLSILAILLIVGGIWCYHLYTTQVKNVIPGKSYELYVINKNRFEPTSMYFSFGKGSNANKVFATTKKTYAKSVQNSDVKFASLWMQQSEEDEGQWVYTATDDSLNIKILNGDNDVYESQRVFKFTNLEVSGGVLTGLVSFKNNDSKSMMLKPVNY